MTGVVDKQSYCALEDQETDGSPNGDGVILVKRCSFGLTEKDFICVNWSSKWNFTRPTTSRRSISGVKGRTGFLDWHTETKGECRRGVYKVAGP